MSKIGDVIITLEDHGYDYNRLGNKSFARYDMVCRSTESQANKRFASIPEATLRSDVIYCRWLSRSQHNILRSGSLEKLLVD